MKKKNHHSAWRPLGTLSGPKIKYMSLHTLLETQSQILNVVVIIKYCCTNFNENDCNCVLILGLIKKPCVFILIKLLVITVVNGQTVT